MGDNDDVTIPGRTILDAVQTHRTPTPRGRITPLVKSFRETLIGLVDDDHTDASILALYKWLFRGEPPARPATSTGLSVWGDYSSRSLSWTDNTAPTQFAFRYYNLDIVNNNESGFKVYRKTGGSDSDRSTAGYSLLTTTAADATDWKDEEMLSATGTYTYIVTAYNEGSGNSIARTAASIDIVGDTPGRISLAHAQPPRVNQLITATLVDPDDPQRDDAIWRWGTHQFFGGSASSQGPSFLPSQGNIGKTISVRVT